MRIILLENYRNQKIPKWDTVNTFNICPIVNYSSVFVKDFSTTSNRPGDTGSLRTFRIPHINLNGQEKSKVTLQSLFASEMNVLSN